MKELLSKSFWQGVKKTFHDSLEGRSLEENALKAPAEGQPNASSGAMASSSPERSADLVTRSTAQ
jgi:hypothetical protein